MIHDQLSTLLNQKIEILYLKEDRHRRVITWERRRLCWAGVKLDDRRNLFSSIGIGTRGAAVTIRPDADLTLHQAMRWNGQFLFLTSIIPGERRDRLEVSAAMAEPVPCRADVQKAEPGMSFPGVLTEKYLGYAQEVPMAVNTLTYVLVTPKAVELTPGSLVEAAGRNYVVQVPHVLDPYKNEYEISRRGDL